MNVTFAIGEVVSDSGYIITNKNGLTQFVAENDSVRIHFESDSGEGKNCSKILSVYDKRRNINYRAMRFLRTHVATVQMFSNVLHDKYRAANYNE